MASSKTLGMFEERRTEERNRGSDYCSARPVSADECDAGMVEKSDVSPMCRMCNTAEETVFHIVSECRVHAQTEYKGRHDKLAKVIHWDLCKKYGVKVQSKWYDHVPEKVE